LQFLLWQLPSGQAPENLPFNLVVARIAPSDVLADFFRRRRRTEVAAHGKSSQGIYHCFPRWQHRNLELQVLVTAAESPVDREAAVLTRLQNLWLT